MLGGMTPAPTTEDLQLLGNALDEARLSLLLDSEIPVAEVTEPVRASVYSQVQPLLVRLKEVPGIHQRQGLLSKAIKPILLRSMPQSKRVA